VKDLQGNTLLEGVTDENGEFSFRVPKREALKVVLKAGMGHMAEWTIPANEITGAASETADVSSETSTDSETKNRAPESASPTSVSSAEIQMAIEKALDRRLQPVVALLERINEPKTTLKDILGGIGYIMGLVGIAAYIRSIKERSKDKGS
jgi:nickel transport protein